MAKQTRKNLTDRSGTVSAEKVQGANSAPRIGGILQDIIDSLPSDFDPAVTYGPGEEAIWYGRIVTCFSPTLAGQSPLTHPALWIDPVVDTVAKITGGSSNYPVLPSALIAYVSQRIAEVNAASGGVPEASADEIVLGLIHNKYVSPARLKVVSDALYQAIADALNAVSTTPGTGTNPTTPTRTPTLEEVTKAGAITDQNIVVSGGQNFLVLLSEANKQGGIYIVTQNADGSLVYQTTLLNNYEGTASFNNGVWGLEFALGKQDAYLNAKRLLMPNTGIELSTIIRTQFPAAVNALKGVWGPETDAVTGKTTDVLFDAKKLFSYLRAEIDEWARTNNLQQRPSSPGPVGTIYCRPKPSSPTTTNPTPTTGAGITEAFFNVTSAQFGTWRNHNLNVPGSQLWPFVLGPDNKDASSYLTITFSTDNNNQYKVTANNPETAADSSFYAKINLRVIPQ